MLLQITKFHLFLWRSNISLGVPWWLRGKESACSAGDAGSLEDSLEESMATHASILAWRIPWTEEPGGLQSMGSQRVGHNWSDLACIVQYFIDVATTSSLSIHLLMDIYVGKPDF